MVKMGFVPHISREILLGPSMSESEKSMAILRWKGVSISIRLLKNRESNGQEQEVDIIHASSLTKLSRDNMT